ncbi:hypothetical protein Msil_0246 [Methylocella silvestris BL2]|uniref:Uncharacterized protein n=1 Tax=Methylocella silvestris (strain DSM 15510 / CIP 108128 / LMG 27833 / NCIMB 13906 / BL2) TaxID=395965 RepID=B8ENY8_METSB|nr:hypothetical protein Msil_0246 [Methylocella silvestris BL2]
MRDGCKDPKREPGFVFILDPNNNEERSAKIADARCVRQRT